MHFPIYRGSSTNIVPGRRIVSGVYVMRTSSRLFQLHFFNNGLQILAGLRLGDDDTLHFPVFPAYPN